MNPQTNASEQDKRRRFFIPSKATAGWFAIMYVICFLVLRFDIGIHQPWFQNRLPTAIAALAAFPFALIIALWLKIQSLRRF